MSSDEDAFAAGERAKPAEPARTTEPAAQTTQPAAQPALPQPQGSPTRPTGPTGLTGSEADGPGAAEPTGSAALGPLRDARTIRPGSAVTVGIAAGVTGVALLGPVLVSPQRSWALISGGVFALVLVWLFVVRPAAVLHAEGVRLINPMRVVDLTWPAIDEVKSRWVLELVSDGHTYTAWGVPADPSRPRYGRNALALGASRVLGRAEEPAPKRTKIDAKVVAAEVEARIAEDRMRHEGRTPRVAAQFWHPVSVGLFLASAAFFVIATFVV